jgi:hypothetical protein
MYIVYVFDIIIAVSYFTIPLQIAYFTVFMPLQDWKAKVTCMLFSTFIVLCGFTHMFHALQMQTVMRIIYGLTAVVSAVTAVALFVVIPHVLNLPIRLEQVRRQGEIDAKYRSLIRQLPDYTLPLRDAQLMNVAKMLLRQLFHKKHVQICVQQRQSNAVCVATDGCQQLMVEKKVYKDNQWLLQEFGHVLHAFMMPPKSLPGVEREGIV